MRDITYEELGCAIVALFKDDLHVPEEKVDYSSIRELMYLLFHKKGTIRFCDTGLILNPSYRNKKYILTCGKIKEV